MSFKDSKVVVIGTGNVGSTTAYSILNQGLCEEVVLIDVNRDKAYAEALDMAHSVYFMNRNIDVHAGDYKDCADADVVIITASAPMPKDSTNRLEMLAPSMRIMKSIVSSVMASGFDGIILVISNPVDIMTYYAWKISPGRSQDFRQSRSSAAARIWTAPDCAASSQSSMTWTRRAFRHLSAASTATANLSYGTRPQSAERKSMM